MAQFRMSFTHNTIKMVIWTSPYTTISGITIPPFSEYIMSTYYVPVLDTRNTTVNITDMVIALTVLQVYEMKYNHHIFSYFPKCYEHLN